MEFKKDLELTKKAEQAHEIWAHWMKYFFTKCSPTGPNGTLLIPADLEKRWKRLMNTDFKDLTDQEKKSDYEIAKKY